MAADDASALVAGTVNLDGATFELKHGSTASMGTVKINNTGHEQLGQWLSSVESSLRAPSTPPSGSQVKLAIVNLENTVWSPLPGIWGNLGQLLDQLRVSRLVLNVREELRWYFFPPTWDTNKSPPDVKDEVIARCVVYRNFGVVWKYYPDRLTTVGLVWYRSEPTRSRTLSLLKDLLKYSRLTCHPLLIALLTTERSISGARTRMLGHIKDIVKAQADSGFHAFSTAQPGKIREEGDWGHTSATVSGINASLADVKLSLLKSRNLAQEMLGSAIPVPADTAVRENMTAASLFIEQQSKFVIQQCDGLIVDVKSYQRTATTLIQGLFNLIAQRQQMMSFEVARDSKILAEQSTQIAEESRIIAQETKRDSTSMKHIAVVTIVFLPGTLVSSLLATPIFNMDPKSNTLTTRQMWIYWVITIPLTIATVFIWISWNWHSDRKRQRRRQKSQSINDDSKSIEPPPALEENRFGVFRARIMAHFLQNRQTPRKA